jgi:predicted PurR-regulated permease PerM
VLIVPVVTSQIMQFAASIPESYAHLVEAMRQNPSRLIAMLGRRMPALEALPTALTSVAPDSVPGIVGIGTGLMTFLTYTVTVLAIGFYWTLEVPRFERLVASLIPVDRRAGFLAAWHEIEFKLGAFIRGQGLAMLAVGAASGVGYFAIGLPNALTLAVLAGLLEAVPMLGPTLAAVPAILVALPLGMTSVLLVIGWAIVVQTLEGYILIPRIMSRAVGVSALVGLIGVLAMGSLYGIMGVFIAIPMIGVLQVVGERMMFEPQPMTATTDEPLSGLDSRVQALRHRVRRRLRTRETRMGIDPSEPDHVVDAVDQQIETTVDRRAAMLLNLQDPSAPIAPARRSHMVTELCQAIETLEHADDRAELALEELKTTESPAAPPVSATQEVARAVEQLDQLTSDAPISVPRRMS